MIGETISHYRILERIGEGGMGQVYKAEDTRLKRIVALKMLLEEENDNEEARARFLREARAASAVNHPNIATIYEIDEVERDGTLVAFIAMEYIGGRPLRDAVGSLELDRALELMQQIAEALAAAHNHGIVHRDIKPANILIDAEGRPKILDFGIAKYSPPLLKEATEALNRTETLFTTPGAIIGTFNYMSPEQASGGEVDARSDIFSLGVVFYELLAGMHPFGSGSVLAIVSAILYAEPPPLTSVCREATPEIERLVHRMMQKDRALRYQNLREVLFDLDAIRRGALHLLDASTYRDAGEESTHRGKRIPAVPPPKRQAGNRTVAVLNFANITGREDDDWLGTGIAETVTSDLKNIEGLSVIGRERVYDAMRRLQLDDREAMAQKAATQIGREIGARWIISGGYQRFGDMLRITARTIEVETGEAIKTVKVDGRIDEVFELQDKVVYQFLHDLDLSLLQRERERIARRETEILDAYEAFSRGIPELFSGSHAGIERAMEHFEHALAIDSGYTIARVALGYALALEAEFLHQPALYHRAIGNLREGLARMPELAEGWVGLALTLAAMGQFDEALAAARRACELAPEEHTSHIALGRVLFLGQGDFSAAAEEFERALEIDPGSGWAALQLAHCCTYLGEYERGESAARRAIESQERSQSGQDGVRIVGAYTQLGQLCALQGRDDEAIEMFERELRALETSDHAMRDRTRIEALARLAAACRRRNRSERAREAYESASLGFAARQAAGVDVPFTRYYIACAAASMGERDPALEHLAKAVASRPAFMRARAKVELDFADLRGDEKFKAILTRQ
ncbi:MAG: protein kinase [Acidobacteria bacterium]|nr:protein kinase [Acidobacteriota bacterium]